MVKGPWPCEAQSAASPMKTTSPDRTYIDYWQDYRTGKQSHFGIRVWADQCCPITNVRAEHPRLLGNQIPLPIQLSGTIGQHSLNNVITEHMNCHADSDLVRVLTGKKSFPDALQ